MFTEYPSLRDGQIEDLFLMIVQWKDYDNLSLGEERTVSMNVSVKAQEQFYSTPPPLLRALLTMVQSSFRVRAFTYAPFSNAQDESFSGQQNANELEKGGKEESSLIVEEATISKSDLAIDDSIIKVESELLLNKKQRRGTLKEIVASLSRGISMILDCCGISAQVALMKMNKKASNEEQTKVHPKQNTDLQALSTAIPSSPSSSSSSASSSTSSNESDVLPPNFTPSSSLCRWYRRCLSRLVDTLLSCLHHPLYPSAQLFLFLIASQLSESLNAFRGASSGNEAKANQSMSKIAYPFGSSVPLSGQCVIIETMKQRHFLYLLNRIAHSVDTAKLAGVQHSDRLMKKAEEKEKERSERENEIISEWRSLCNVRSRESVVKKKGKSKHHSEDFASNEKEKLFISDLDSWKQRQIKAENLEEDTKQSVISTRTEELQKRRLLCAVCGLPLTTTQPWRYQTDGITAQSTANRMFADALRREEAKNDEASMLVPELDNSERLAIRKPSQKKMAKKKTGFCLLCGCALHLCCAGIDDGRLEGESEAKDLNTICDACAFLYCKTTPVCGYELINVTHCELKIEDDDMNSTEMVKASENHSEYKCNFVSSGNFSVSNAFYHLLLLLDLIKVYVTKESSQWFETSNFQHSSDASSTSIDSIPLIADFGKMFEGKEEKEEKAIREDNDRYYHNSDKEELLFDALYKYLCTLFHQTQNNSENNGFLSFLANSLSFSASILSISLSASTHSSELKKEEKIEFSHQLRLFQRFVSTIHDAVDDENEHIQEYKAGSAASVLTHPPFLHSILNDAVSSQSDSIDQSKSPDTSILSLTDKDSKEKAITVVNDDEEEEKVNKKHKRKEKKHKKKQANKDDSFSNPQQAEKEGFGFDFKLTSNESSSSAIEEASANSSDANLIKQKYEADEHSTFIPFPSTFLMPVRPLIYDFSFPLSQSSSSSSSLISTTSSSSSSSSSSFSFTSTSFPTISTSPLLRSQLSLFPTSLLSSLFTPLFISPLLSAMNSTTVSLRAEAVKSIAQLFDADPSLMNEKTFRTDSISDKASKLFEGETKTEEQQAKELENSEEKKENQQEAQQEERIDFNLKVFVLSLVRDKSATVRDSAVTVIQRKLLSHLGAFIRSDDASEENEKCSDEWWELNVLSMLVEDKTVIVRKKAMKALESFVFCASDAVNRQQLTETISFDLDEKSVQYALQRTVHDLFRELELSEHLTQDELNSTLRHFIFLGTLPSFLNADYLDASIPSFYREWKLLLSENDEESEETDSDKNINFDELCIRFVDAVELCDETTLVSDDWWKQQIQTAFPHLTASFDSNMKSMQKLKTHRERSLFEQKRQKEALHVRQFGDALVKRMLCMKKVIHEIEMEQEGLTVREGDKEGKEEKDDFKEEEEEEDRNERDFERSFSNTHRSYQEMSAISKKKKGMEQCWTIFRCMYLLTTAIPMLFAKQFNLLLSFFIASEVSEQQTGETENLKCLPLAAEIVRLMAVASREEELRVLQPFGSVPNEDVNDLSAEEDSFLSFNHKISSESTLSHTFFSQMHNASSIFASPSLEMFELAQKKLLQLLPCLPLQFAISHINSPLKSPEISVVRCLCDIIIHQTHNPAPLLRVVLLSTLILRQSQPLRNAKFSLSPKQIFPSSSSLMASSNETILQKTSDVSLENQAQMQPQLYSAPAPLLPAFSFSSFPLQTSSTVAVASFRIRALIIYSLQLISIICRFIDFNECMSESSIEEMTEEMRPIKGKPQQQTIENETGGDVNEDKSQIESGQHEEKLLETKKSSTQKSFCGLDCRNFYFSLFRLCVFYASFGDSQISSAAIEATGHIIAHYPIILLKEFSNSWKYTGRSSLTEYPRYLSGLNTVTSQKSEESSFSNQVQQIKEANCQGSASSFTTWNDQITRWLVPHADDNSTSLSCKSTLFRFAEQSSLSPSVEVKAAQLRVILMLLKDDEEKVKCQQKMIALRQEMNARQARKRKQRLEKAKKKADLADQKKKKKDGIISFPFGKKKSGLISQTNQKQNKAQKKQANTNIQSKQKMKKKTEAFLQSMKTWLSDYRKGAKQTSNALLNPPTSLPLSPPISPILSPSLESSISIIKKEGERENEEAGENQTLQSEESVKEEEEEKLKIEEVEELDHKDKQISEEQKSESHETPKDSSLRSESESESESSCSSSSSSSSSNSSDSDSTSSYSSSTSSSSSSVTSSTFSKMNSASISSSFFLTQSRKGALPSGYSLTASLLQLHQEGIRCCALSRHSSLRLPALRIVEIGLMQKVVHSGLFTSVVICLLSDPDASVANNAWNVLLALIGIRRGQDEGTNTGGKWSDEQKRGRGKNAKAQIWKNRGRGVDKDWLKNRMGIDENGHGGIFDETVENKEKTLKTNDSLSLIDQKKKSKRDQSRFKQDMGDSIGCINLNDITSGIILSYTFQMRALAERNNILIKENLSTMASKLAESKSKENNSFENDMETSEFLKEKAISQKEKHVKNVCRELCVSLHQLTKPSASDLTSPSNRCTFADLFILLNEINSHLLNRVFTSLFDSMQNEFTMIDSLKEDSTDSSLNTMANHLSNSDCILIRSLHFCCYILNIVGSFCINSSKIPKQISSFLLRRCEFLVLKLSPIIETVEHVATVNSTKGNLLLSSVLLTKPEFKKQQIQSSSANSTISTSDDEQEIIIAPPSLMKCSHQLALLRSVLILRHSIHNSINNSIDRSSYPTKTPSTNFKSDPSSNDASSSKMDKRIPLRKAPTRFELVGTAIPLEEWRELHMKSISDTSYEDSEEQQNQLDDLFTQKNFKENSDFSEKIETALQSYLSSVDDAGILLHPNFIEGCIRKTKAELNKLSASSFSGDGERIESEHSNKDSHSIFEESGTSKNESELSRCEELLSEVNMLMTQEEANGLNLSMCSDDEEIAEEPVDNIGSPVLSLPLSPLVEDSQKRKGKQQRKNKKGRGVESSETSMEEYDWEVESDSSGSEDEDEDEDDINIIDESSDVNIIDSEDSDVESASECRSEPESNKKMSGAKKSNNKANSQPTNKPSKSSTSKASKKQSQSEDNKPHNLHKIDSNKEKQRKQKNNVNDTSSSKEIQTRTKIKKDRAKVVLVDDDSSTS
eukprot:MONOS_4286.1-p1 / transcript=MONOS_4286.1 / gene=MONOS_4286 / organism=Monocercomonoides_exilis_PA203 / gene_product=unspecified product / transcript_product=unspecified product / location=Mono_scaffold00112:23138-32446(-) / protein_length=3103 / sequence_SO=supercontig / SO=protein_coding / is_pseudo=false